MKLVYKIREVRDNVVCCWYNLDPSLGLKIFKDVMKEVNRLIAQGEHVKVYLTTKGV